MLQAGLDLAREKARNEKQEGIKLFLINFALGFSPENAIPQEKAGRKSIKKKTLLASEQQRSTAWRKYYLKLIKSALKTVSFEILLEAK